MSKDMGYLVIVGMVAFAILLFYLQLRFDSAAARRRSERIKATAASLGLSFTEKDDQVAQEILANFSRANSDKDLDEYSIKAINIWRGELAGARFLTCDFKWMAGRGKNKGILSTTLTRWQSSDLDLPEFLLMSSEWGSEASGFSDSELLHIAQPETFAKQYLLAGKNESAVRALFRPEILSYFAGHPGWTVENHGNGVIICKLYNDVKPDKLLDFLNQCEEIYRLFRKG